MKVSIFVSVIFLACYCLAGKFDDVPAHYKANYRKGEDYDGFWRRMQTSRNYSLPVHECFHPAGFYMGEQVCYTGIDSCCFAKHKWICIPKYGINDGKGYCFEHRESVDGPKEKYFKHLV